MGYVGDGPKPQLEVGDISTKDVTATGDLTVDTNTLFVDSTNNRVGIGTTSPQAGTGLHIKTGASGATPNGDLIIEDDANVKILLSCPAANTAQIHFGDDAANNVGKIQYDHSDNSLAFSTDATERMRIDSSGNVGVGTTTVDATLQVGALDSTGSNRGAVSIKTEASDATIGESAIYIEEQSGAEGYYLGVSSDGGMFFSNSGASTPTLFLGDDDKVGIRTTPDCDFHIDGSSVASLRFGNIGTSGNSALRISRDDTTVTNGNPLGFLEFGGNDSTSNTDAAFAYIGGVADGTHAAGSNATRLEFATAPSGSPTPVERMRIDSSGNLLVGTTDRSQVVNNGTTGIVLGYDGFIGASRTGSLGEVMILDREDSDGSILSFRKDGTTVGSIGIANSDLYIDGLANHSGIRFQASSLIPRYNGAVSDNAVDLGTSGNRFKDLYLGGGAYIGGTGSANYLDDYEEGTWTPTYVGSSSNPSVTYDEQHGFYVKIGSQVIARLELHTDAVSGGSGNCYIEGLPFTPAARNGNRAGSLIVGYSSSFAGDAPQGGYINDANAQIILTTTNSGNAGSNMDHTILISDLGTGTDDNFLMATLIYET